MNENFNITSRHLEMLITLDKERSFVETSRKLGVSDNYAHQMVKHLEKNLGVKITQPAQPGLGRNVKFTPDKVKQLCAMRISHTTTSLN